MHKIALNLRSNRYRCFRKSIFFCGQNGKLFKKLWKLKIFTRVVVLRAESFKRFFIHCFRKLHYYYIKMHINIFTYIPAYFVNSFTFNFNPTCIYIFLKKLYIFSTLHNTNGAWKINFNLFLALAWPWNLET